VLHAGGGYLAYNWQNGSQDSTFTVTSGGTYSVTVAGMGGCSTTDQITVTMSSASVDLGADTTICIGESIVFDPGPGYASYHWQDNSTNQTFTASQTGTYWVQVSNDDGCTAVDSINLFVDDPSISVDLGPDKKVCPGTSVTLQPAFGIFNSYLWSTGATTQTITVTNPGTYYLTVLSGCGETSDSITVSNWPAVNVNLGPDLNLCYGESTVLEPPIGYSYVWQDNSTFPFYTVTEPGIYYCEATDIHGCTGSDTIYVDVADKVDLGADTTLLCTGQTVTLTAGSGFDYYTWSNGEYGVQSINVDTGGMYSVSVNYTFGCESADSVYVDEHPVPVASITGPDNFCVGDTIWLHAPMGEFQYFWNNQAGEPDLQVSTGGNYTLKMENMCGESTDDKTVEMFSLPYVDLGSTVVLFPGESITLDAGNFQSFVWEGNPDFNQQQYTVTYDDINISDTITVEVNDGHCKNSGSIVIEAYNVEVPIVFTPNGDGWNDTFTPKVQLTGVNSHDIIIFNRWGEKVWESKDFSSGWDGKQNGHYVADGTYFWVLEVYYGNENLKKIYKGSVTVLGTGN
jgi:gliding motility-associated-like protein